MGQSLNIEFNKHFKEFNETKCRYRVAYGSAGSGKSVNIAQDYIMKLADTYYKGANLLVLRKVDDTNRNSTFAELCSAIYRIFPPDVVEKCWKITTNPLMIENFKEKAQQHIEKKFCYTIEESFQKLQEIQALAYEQDVNGKYYNLTVAAKVEELKGKLAGLYVEKQQIDGVGVNITFNRNYD